MPIKTIPLSLQVDPSLDRDIVVTSIYEQLKQSGDPYLSILAGTPSEIPVRIIKGGKKGSISYRQYLQRPMIVSIPDSILYQLPNKHPKTFQLALKEDEIQTPVQDINDNKIKLYRERILTLEAYPIFEDAERLVQIPIRAQELDFYTIRSALSLSDYYLRIKEGMRLGYERFEILGRRGKGKTFHGIRTLVDKSLESRDLNVVFAYNQANSSLQILDPQKYNYPYRNDEVQKKWLQLLESLKQTPLNFSDTIAEFCEKNKPDIDIVLQGKEPSPSDYSATSRRVNVVTDDILYMADDVRLGRQKIETLEKVLYNLAGLPSICRKIVIAENQISFYSDLFDSKILELVAVKFGESPLYSWRRYQESKNKHYLGVYKKNLKISKDNTASNIEILQVVSTYGVQDIARKYGISISNRMTRLVPTIVGENPRRFFMLLRILKDNNIRSVVSLNDVLSPLERHFKTKIRLPKRNFALLDEAEVFVSGEIYSKFLKGEF